MLKSVKRDKTTYPQDCFDLLITFFEKMYLFAEYFIIIKIDRQGVDSVVIEISQGVVSRVSKFLYNKILIVRRIMFLRGRGNAYLCIRAEGGRFPSTVGTGRLGRGLTPGELRPVNQQTR